ncbi:MAG: Na+:solute symporter [bacterium]|nr:Na+:solute symporter [bacterium]
MHQASSHLALIDWLIILGFLVMTIAVGFFVSRRGRRSVREYFTSGGSTPWWLLGTSMVATSFAADTPLTLAGWVVTKGIAQNWFWWCQIPVTMLGVFFIARLWRRANLVTDTELVHLRYSGRSASVLRGFKALYLSLVYACLVIGWVNLAMVKIIQLALPDMPRVPVVDGLLLKTYVHTPLSNELPAQVRGAIRTGRLDPLQAYYEHWSLHDRPVRAEVMRDIEQVIRRVDYYRQTRAESGDGPLPPELAALQEYVTNLESGPFLARLGITEWDREIAGLIESGPRPDSSVPIAELEVVYGVHRAVAAVSQLKIILVLFLVVLAYTVMSGLWGVLITDFIQFWIAMVGCVILAILAVHQLGGLDALLQRLGELYTPDKAYGMVSMIPVGSAGDLDLMPMSHFLVFLLFAWYVSGLTDGGSYFAQRMLAARNERHAALGYLWYAVAHYCLRMWPWLIVGCAAAVMFPYARDTLTQQYPGGAVAENGYIKVMLAVLPSGLLGLMLASFLAAFMSTVSTQLNLGASYLLNDFYRPFVKQRASERHYVVVSQAATVLMAAVGLTVSLFYDTISEAWFLIGTLNAGIGFVYLLRWFWWRVNAWTELSCLASLLGLVLAVKLFPEKLGPYMPPYPLNLLVLVPYSVGIALTVTLLTKPVATEKLVAFLKRVQPGGPGWKHIEAIVRTSDPTFRCRSPLQWANLRRWILASAAIYAFLFGVGKLIVGDAFAVSRWLPQRAIGTLLILLGIVLGCSVWRSLSPRKWN